MVAVVPVLGTYKTHSTIGEIRIVILCRVTTPLPVETVINNIVHVQQGEVLAEAQAVSLMDNLCILQPIAPNIHLIIHDLGQQNLSLPLMMLGDHIDFL